MRPALVVAPLLLLVPSTTSAQPAKSGGEYLGEVADHYSDVQEYRASYRYRRTRDGQTRTEAGTIYVQPRDTRWRIDIATKRRVSRSEIFNVDVAWTVDHTARAITERSLLPISHEVGLAFFTTNLWTGVETKVDSSGRFGTKNDIVLEVSPEIRDDGINWAAHETQWLVIDPRTSHVKESIVLDSKGELHHFTFRAPNERVTLNPDIFVVTPSAFPAYTHRTE